MKKSASKITIAFFLANVALHLISMGSIIASALNFEGTVKTALVVGIQAVANLFALLLTKMPLSRMRHTSFWCFTSFALTTFAASYFSFLSIAWAISWSIALISSSLLLSQINSDLKNNFRDDWISVNKSLQMANVGAAMLSFGISPILLSRWNISTVFMISSSIIIVSLFLYVPSRIGGYNSGPSNSETHTEQAIDLTEDFRISSLCTWSTYFYWCLLGIFTVVEVNILKERFQASPELISTIFLISLSTSLIALKIIGSKFIDEYKKRAIFLTFLISYAFSVVYFTTTSLAAVFLCIIAIGFSDGFFKLATSTLTQHINDDALRLQSFAKQRLSQFIGLLTSSLVMLALNSSTYPNQLVLATLLSFFGMILVAFRFGKIKQFALSTLLLFSIFPQTSKAETFKVGLSNLPSKLNPAEILDISSAVVASQLYDSLYEYTSDNKLVPILASGHVISPDSMKIRIRIDGTKTFSDGSPLKAQDVINSIHSAVSSLKNQSRWAFGDIVGFNDFVEGKSPLISGIQMAKDGSIEFEFNKASPLFLKKLAAPYFMITKQDKRGKLIGTGDFSLSSHSNESILLKKVNKGFPESIEFLPFTNKTAPKDVDFKIISSSEESSGFLESGFSIVDFDQLQTIILQLNPKSDLFVSPKNRCSFAYDFKTAAMNEYDWNDISEGLPFWSDSFQEKPPAHKKQRSHIKMKILFTNSAGNFSGHNNVKLKNDLDKLGYDVEFEEVKTSELIQVMKKGRYAATLWGYIPDYIDPDALLSPLLRTGQQFNWSNFSNKTIDSLLEVGESAVDSSARKIVYKKIIEEMEDDCRISFLGSEKGQFAIRKNWALEKLSGLGLLSVKFRNLGKK